MKTKFFFPFCAMIALSSTAHAFPFFWAVTPDAEAQTASFWLTSPDADTEAQTASFWLTTPDTDTEAQTASFWLTTPDTDTEAQTASFWLTSPDADTETQTASFWLTSPDADAQTASIRFTSPDALKSATEAQTAEALFSDPAPFNADSQTACCSGTVNFFLNWLKHYINEGPTKSDSVI